MAGENKRPSAASNVKALVTQPEGLKSIRKNMGLGDTLGALPVENGGTGSVSVEGVRRLVLGKSTVDEFVEFAQRLTYDTWPAGISAYATSANLDGVKTIANEAFLNVDTLRSVRSKTVASIGNGAFSGCRSLEVADLPAASSIGYSAFRYCRNLVSVNFPEATYVGESAFGDCDKAKTIRVGKNGMSLVIENNYSSPGGAPFWYSANDANGTYLLALSGSVEIKKREIAHTSIGCTYAVDMSGCSSLNGLNAFFFSGDGSVYVWIPATLKSLNMTLLNGSGGTSMRIYCEAKSKPDTWSGRENGATWMYGKTHDQFMSDANLK